MSSRKNKLQTFPVIINGAMASTSTLHSAPVNVEYLDNIGFQANFTGTPVGTFSVEVSADYLQTATGVVQNSGNWIALTLSAVPAAAGAAGSIYVDVTQISAPWIRLSYTNTSSSGTLNAFATAKEI